LTQLLGISKKDVNDAKDPDTGDATGEVPDERLKSEGLEDAEPDICSQLAADGKMDDDDDDDNTESEYVKERVCCDEIKRVHRNGDDVDTQGEDSAAIWDSIVGLTQPEETGKITKDSGPMMTTSKWDDLFAGKDDVTDEGLDDLLDLLGGDKESSEQQINDDEEEEVKMSMLSQGGRAIAEEIISHAMTKKNLLDVACPGWKENVAFTLRQKDPNEIQNALDNVRESRSRMEETKRRILQAWERQHAALELFESTLVASLNRSKKAGDTEEEARDCQLKDHQADHDNN
jgi:hypothetical protein